MIMFAKHCTFERYLFLDKKVIYIFIYKRNTKSIICAIQGSIGEWNRCNYDIPFKQEILDSFPYHANLSRKGFRSLIYSGDHDMKVPFLATQAWIKSLNYSIVDDWRQWYYNDQVAGYIYLVSQL
jgi:serine carboxypeptidase-like 19/serine carboxypeptidase-like clade 1